MIALGLGTALVWLVSAILGFEQFGMSTVVIGLGFAYSGTVLFAARKFSDRRRAGLPGFKRTLHVTLTGSMLIVLALDVAGYQLAVSRLPRVDGPLVSGLEDIFVAVAMLTITVGLVLPGMIAHAVGEVSNAAKRLVSGTLRDFTQAMEALGAGELGAARVELEFTPVAVRSHDEIGEMASSFNALQLEIQRSAFGLVGAREGLALARKQLLDSYRELQARVSENRQLIIDLTEARDAAEAASVAKDRFVAKMSHEIRTPMNGILTTIDLLRDSDMSPAQRKLMAIVEKSGETLLALATEVLDYSRFTQRNVISDQVEFDLIELVRNRFEEMTVPAAKAATEFRLTLPEERPSLGVVGDPLQLTLVLQNVLSNALKFTERGTVTMALSLRGETAERIDLQVCVTDTGIGMSDEFKLRIFEPFAQENESSTRPVGGTGLGLSIVKEIVDSLGGGITIDTGRGQGTNVCITWTMAKALPQPQASARDLTPAAAPAAAPYAQQPQKILVAEDNPINQEVIAASLTRLGQSFTIVDNGGAVLAALDEDQFSLVLMDCRMPVMDGLEAAQAIRQREGALRTVRIPIVAISANTTQADRESCFASGMDDHIAKPFTLAELKQKLEKWIPTQPYPVSAGAARPVATAGAGAPRFQLLEVEKLRAFEDLQMPGEPSIIHELIDSFLRTAPQQLHLIGALLSENDHKGSIIAAHGMKSASAAIGLTALSDAFRSIEVLIDGAHGDEASLAVQRTAHVLNKSLHELSVFVTDLD
jgi:signal transduction histidine kinase/HPt (histidine-containing phosphotransfer) domain-containing protein/ActR/RegA family two-component response regulator